VNQSDSSNFLSDDTEIRSGARENIKDTNRILSDGTEILSDISLEDNQEQYVPIYPDLPNSIENDQEQNVPTYPDLSNLME